MANQLGETANRILKTLPVLPLSGAQWQAIFQKLELSPQQADIAQLMLRDASNRQIVAVLGISDGTVKEQQKRLFHRTGTHSRVQLAMRVLALSHELTGNGQHIQTDDT